MKQSSSSWSPRSLSWIPFLLLLTTFIGHHSVWAVYHFSEVPPQQQRMADPSVFLIDKDAVDPKLGTQLTILYQQYVQRSANSPNGGAARVEEDDEFVTVDIVFTEKFDNEQAKEVLRSALKNDALDSLSCFAFMCSARIPVCALHDIASLDQVQAVHLAMAHTNAQPGAV